MDKKTIEIFDRWAKNYDKSIQIAEKNDDWLYKGYTKILIAVKNEVKKYLTLSKDTIVLDIGTGTGNLLFLIVEEGYKTIGVEPSSRMRKEIKKKNPNIPVIAGDFLALPLKDNFIDAIVSSYAWHHLSNKEKVESIKEMKRVLKQKGIIVIADLMFLNATEKEKMIEVFKSKKLYDLIEDIESEEYGYVDILSYEFHKLEFKIKSKQLTDLVWLLTAQLTS